MTTFDDILQRFLLDPASGVLPGIKDPSIDNVAWHDFAQYEFLQKPVVYEPPVGSSGGGGGGGEHGGWFPPPDCQPWACPGGPRGLCLEEVTFELDDPRIQLARLQSFLATVSRTVDYLIAKRLGILAGTPPPEVAIRAKSAYETAILQGAHLSRFYEAYASIPREANRDGIFRSASASWWIDPCAIINGGGWGGVDPLPVEVSQDVERLVGHIETSMAAMASVGGSEISAISALPMRVLAMTDASQEYDFDVFAPRTTNVGLRLVYRQEWRMLGAQRGEVVRTLPLGPKQSEKVSFKVFRRNKVQRTAESLRAVESTTEVTDTSKDSVDIVNETASSQGWKAEASASAGFLGIGASAGYSSNEEASSKVATTNTYLTESVQKTANKVRMESKLLVSTEGEETFEATTASEVQNPNDEIAVTYVYSKLQRQYEVFTHLNEVNTVVFVAEDMPFTTAELEKWIKDHDWILARVLLDDSFRDALSAINQDKKQTALGTDFVQQYADAMEASTGVVSAFAGKLTSLELQQADITQEIQRSRQQIEKEKLERERSAALYDIKRDRLIEHVRSNILHYCRAVWSREDPDQRALRYQKRGLTVPTAWEFLSGSAVIDIETLRADPILILTGEFQPVAGSERPIEDVINPAGPIGYYGNYAVFYAQPDLRFGMEQVQGGGGASLFDVLDLIRQPYIDSGDPPGFLDPARAYIEATEPLPDPIPPGTRAEMTDLLPELRAELAKRGVTTEELVQVDALFTSERYYEYLFRKEFTRQLVLDTNNLIIDIEVGTGSTLEAFKRLHRYVDVQKATQERDKLQLENSRLQARLDAEPKLLEDPDIEKMTIVKGCACCHHHDHHPPGHAFGHDLVEGSGRDEDGREDDGEDS